MYQYEYYFMLCNINKYFNKSICICTYMYLSKLLIGCLLYMYGLINIYYHDYQLLVPLYSCLYVRLYYLRNKINYNRSFQLFITSHMLILLISILLTSCKHDNALISSITITIMIYFYAEYHNYKNETVICRCRCRCTSESKFCLDYQKYIIENNHRNSLILDSIFESEKYKKCEKVFQYIICMYCRAI